MGPTFWSVFGSLGLTDWKVGPTELNPPPGRSVSVHQFGPGVVDLIGLAPEEGFKACPAQGCFIFPSSHVALVERADQFAGLREMFGPSFLELLVEIECLTDSVRPGGVVGRVDGKVILDSRIADGLLLLETRIGATAECSNG